MAEIGIIHTYLIVYENNLSYTLCFQPTFIIAGMPKVHPRIPTSELEKARQMVQW